MQFYRCKCGKARFWGSGEVPADCEGCDECGTTLTQHPEDHRTPIPHDWMTLYHQSTRLPYQVCRRCHTRKNSEQEVRVDGLLLVPHDDQLRNNTWCLSPLPGGRLCVMTRCTNGHLGQLDHTIAANGVVSPSVVCQRDGCGFHEFIVLEGWAEVVTAAGMEGLAGRPPFGSDAR